MQKERREENCKGEVWEEYCRRERTVTSEEISGGTYVCFETSEIGDGEETEGQKSEIWKGYCIKVKHNIIIGKENC